MKASTISIIKKRKKLGEIIGVFFLLPLIIALQPIRIPILLALYTILLLVTLLYWRRHKNAISLRAQFFPNFKLHDKSDFYRELIMILKRFLILGIAMTLIAWLWIPEHFLQLPKKYPYLFPVILVAYPLFSVVPQGIVYRCFLIQRYGSIFTKEKYLWITAAFLFAWGHIILGYWQSFAAALIGGFLFYHTYLKTHSPFLANLEHALYGNLAFTLGYGIWLYYPQIKNSGI